MADVVQYRMERMVSELDDLERRGFFSRAEIAEIVRNRRKFEYRLKRPSPLKSDFLAYIDYEKSLDRLRILRKNQKARQLKEKGNRKMKKTESDFAGVRRIIELYRMATTRFKGDLDLWFQYLEFCRDRKNGRLKKALAQAVRYHPKIPALWIYAASWEFDQNLNAAAARAMMQSGLRVCSTSEDLWVEYLRMELTYLNKLMARKVELGENVGTLVRKGDQAGEEEWKDEHKEEFMALEDQVQGQDEGLDEEPDLFRKQGYNVLRTVYLGAIDAIPSSLNLRRRFLEILEATDLAHSEEMQKEILADMRRDFSKDPEYWDWLAKVGIRDLSNKVDINKKSVRCQVEKSLEVYEEAVSAVPSGAMFDLYVKFLVHIIDSNETASHSIVEYSSRLEKVFEQAESVGCLTEDLAHQHISVHLQAGRIDEARKLAEKYTEGKFPDAVQLWVLRISMELKMNRKDTELSRVFQLLRKPLKSVAVSYAESLWVMALESFASNKSYFNTLLEISLTSLAREGGSDEGFSLSSSFVEFVLQKDGIHKARNLYNRFLALPRPGLALYKFCIQLETNLAVDGDKDSLRNARKLFESALATYKQDINLWRNYHSLETKVGTSETTNAVYWRARKTLGDAVALVAATV